LDENKHWWSAHRDKTDPIIFSLVLCFSETIVRSLWNMTQAQGLRNKTSSSSRSNYRWPTLFPDGAFFLGLNVFWCLIINWPHIMIDQICKTEWEQYLKSNHDFKQIKPKDQQNRNSSRKNRPYLLPRPKRLIFLRHQSIKKREVFLPRSLSSALVRERFLFSPTLGGSALLLSFCFCYSSLSDAMVMVVFILDGAWRGRRKERLISTATPLASLAVFSALDPTTTSLSHYINLGLPHDK
jgi:hypothetical protein